MCNILDSGCQSECGSERCRTVFEFSSCQRGYQAKLKVRTFLICTNVLCVRRMLFYILSSHSTDSVPGYGRVGEAGGSSRSSETGKSQGYGAQRSPGPLLAKADNLGGYNNGATSYSGYQGGKAGQGFPQSSSGYPGGFERQQSYNSGASSNGLTGGYSRYCNLVISLPPMYNDQLQ